MMRIMVFVGLYGGVSPYSGKLPCKNMALAVIPASTLHTASGGILISQGLCSRPCKQLSCTIPQRQAIIDIKSFVGTVLQGLVMC